MLLNSFDKEVAKMRSLIERIEKPHTGYEGLMNEERHLNEGVVRRVESPGKVFEVLDQIGKNQFVCLGHVSGANLDLPKVKRVNPKTNRMKTFDDFETFGKEIGSENEISALVQITSYNFRYFNNSDMKAKYADYKSKLNDIRSKYGLEAVADKENGYTQTMNYGSGVDVYNGNDESKKGNFYVAANTHGCQRHRVIYAVDGNGNIVEELTQEQIKPYLKAKNEEIAGVKALREMNKDEEEIQRYIDEVQSLKMRYQMFEGNSILWIAATVNGQKIVYINSNLKRSVNDIDVNPEDFVTKAMERYNVEMQNMPE